MLGILLVLLWGCVSVAFILTLKEHSKGDKEDNDEANKDEVDGVREESDDTQRYRNITAQTY